MLRKRNMNLHILALSGSLRERIVVLERNDAMNKMLALTSLLALTLALAACGDASDTDTTPDPEPEPQPSAADIADRWASACVDPGNGQGFTLTFDLTETTWALDYAAFADAACATPNLTVHIEGGYELGAASAAVEGAREGDFGFGVKTVTPHSAGAADFLTMACGGGTFADGVATDIAAGCAGLGAYPIADCPTDHDIVALDGDTLRFGARPADNDMCTPDKRPTALGVPLTRQP